jgi:hypothetical protein
LINSGFSGRFDVPKFCHACGCPCPWTENALAAANELVDELDALSEDEKEQLKQSIADVVENKPNAPVAANRFKRLTAKAGAGAASMFKEILVNVLSEVAKKQVGM